MRKTLCLLLALLTLGLAACGGASGEAEEHDAVVVGFSQVGSESDWRVANTRSMTEALSGPGYELLMENARQKQENQLAAVRNFIMQGVDMIVIAPTAETGWDDVLGEAREAEIPVIIVDRAVDVQDQDLYLTMVGSDFLNEGRRAVAWLEEELQRRGLDESEVRILHLQGTEGATSQIMRTRAIMDGAATHRNWTVAATLPCDYTEAKAYEEVRDYLLRDQDIDVIYSENDNMTFGAMRALDEAGLSYGSGGEVTVISFDAVKAALQYCLEGKIDLCVECNPLHGPRVEELIRQYLAGKSIPKRIFVEEAVFTRADLSQEFIDAREY